MKRKNVNSVEDTEMSGQQANEKRVTPPQRRHHGLYNHGATCDLDSVLQVLFMTTELHDRLDSKFRKDVNLRKIFEGLKETTCGTENITATFGLKNVYEQRDAAECLKMILEQISPKASEVFRGHQTFKLKCPEGHIINVNTSFCTLPLSLKDTPDITYSVQNRFGWNFHIKTYTGDNMVYCSACNKKTEATIRYEMVEAPQILILHLKRFDFDFNTRSQFKLDRCVEVPCELQLKNQTYKLYGMVNHMGSIRGGHYTATVLSEDNTWYECNDSHVSKVKQQLFAEDRTFSSRTVYLLMYRAQQRLRYDRYDQGNTNDRNLLSWKDSHHTTYSEESSFKMILYTKPFTGENKVSCNEKIKATNSSDKETIRAHKVELINCLMADHSYILQHAHAEQIITDRQYQNIKEESSLKCVTELIDYVILFNGQKSCTDFLGVLKLPDVLETYPQLEEIMNEMLRSNSGRNA